MEKYTFLNKLGRGRYGEVWLVQTPDSALVALKKIPLDVCPARSSEVEVLSSLEHPNITQYYESFRSASHQCIVMEYVEGGDLSQRLKLLREANQSFSEDQIWNWLMGTAQALDHIHSNKVIHRDLKPSNLLLTKTGEVKISDFGFSRILNCSEELALTGVGTSYYLAPEICSGHAYDAKADVWSFGCILYELCALRRPFEGDNLVAIVNKIVRDEPHSLPERFSEELRSLIFMMLNKDSELRPSVKEVIEYVEKFRGEHRKTRKSYQREMSIHIPTSTHVTPASSGTESQRHPADRKTKLNCNLTPNDLKEDLTCRVKRRFTFSDSLLRECPNSPIRPMLMGDFIRRKLGDLVFETVSNLLASQEDPALLLKEEPGLLSDICGVQNLQLIDAGIAFGVFKQNV